MPPRYVTYSSVMTLDTAFEISESDGRSFFSLTCLEMRQRINSIDYRPYRLRSTCGANLSALSCGYGLTCINFGSIQTRMLTLRHVFQLVDVCCCRVITVHVTDFSCFHSTAVIALMWWLCHVEFVRNTGHAHRVSSKLSICSADMSTSERIRSCTTIPGTFLVQQ